MRHWIIQHKEGEDPKVVSNFNGTLPQENSGLEGDVKKEYFAGHSLVDIPLQDFEYLKAEYIEPDYIVSYDSDKLVAKTRLENGDLRVIIGHRILKYINGLNQEKTMTQAQSEAYAATFSVILTQLLAGGVVTARDLTVVADLSGTFYTETDRTEILYFMNWMIDKYNFS